MFVLILVQPILLPRRILVIIGFVFVIPTSHQVTDNVFVTTGSTMFVLLPALPSLQPP